MKTFTPQFTLDDLYRSPFGRQRALDPVSGTIIYTDIERTEQDQEQKTGIELLDLYIDMLNSYSVYSCTAFALAHGVPVRCFSSFIFALTGLSAIDFQHAYMMRKADDLLRYTWLSASDVACYCGWTPVTLCRIFRKKYKQTPTERRWDLRDVGDCGRYAI